MDNETLAINRYKAHSTIPEAKLRRVGDRIHVVLTFHPKENDAFIDADGLNGVEADILFAGENWSLANLFYSVERGNVRLDYYFERVK